MRLSADPGRWERDRSSRLSGVLAGNRRDLPSKALRTGLGVLGMDSLAGYSRFRPDERQCEPSAGSAATSIPTRLFAPSGLEELRVATERTTVLLEERYAALIVAAVTGQIDLGNATDTPPCARKWMLPAGETTWPRR